MTLAASSATMPAAVAPPAAMRQSHALEQNMENPATQFVIIGGGLAGCECALALARAGIASTLFEQKPEAFSPAHVSEGLGELVCSNSFRSNDVQGSGVGLLKQEMRELGSEVMAVAETCSVPAGKALAVDRELFSARLTARVEAEPLITLVRRQIASLDDPALEGKTVIVAAGPLVSENLAASLASVISGDDGPSRLYFYDAIAPIVRADSVDMSIAFRGSRYGNDAAEEIAESYDNLMDMYYKNGSADGPDGNPGEGVRNLFDGDKNTKYCLDVRGKIEVTFELNQAHAVEAYMFRTGNDTMEYSSRNPDSWELYGRSSASDEWTLIHEVKNGEENMDATNHIWYGFEVEDPKEYKYYKFVFRENGIIQLSEIRLLGEE